MALPMWVTNLENKWTLLKVCLNLRRRVVKLPQYITLKKERRMRKKGIEDPRYTPLKNMKNKYAGKRCFIIATGPSLTIEDIELLGDEYTFGMNSICRIYNQTSWRPTFYGIQDRHVFDKMKDVVYNQDESTVMFMSSELCDQKEKRKNIVQFPLDVAYHYVNFKRLDDYYSMFSDDCYDIVYDGYSITYSLIQIAIYLGFKNIYLLGADCNYVAGAKNHFVESGYVDKNAIQNHDKMLTGYMAAKEYADTHGISIVNCTRGGMLEVFERIPLEKIVNQKVMP